MAKSARTLAAIDVDERLAIRHARGMKQIDLEPRDYKGEPMKGEPILGPNWLPIALQFGAMFAVMAIVRYFVL